MKGLGLLYGALGAGYSFGACTVWVTWRAGGAAPPSPVIILLLFLIGAAAAVVSSVQAGKIDFLLSRHVVNEGEGLTARDHRD